MNELIENLNAVAKSDLAQYFDSIKTSSAQIACICRNLSHVLSSFEDFSNILQIQEFFFKYTIPILVEVLLRRKSLRENGVDIQNALEVVVCFLSLPCAWNVVELCELRNLLLLDTNAQSFKFITSKLIKATNNNAYFSDFGQPNILVTVHSMGCKYTPFWSNNWESVLGRSQAIGHFLHAFIPVSSLKCSERVADGECDDHIWIGGCISMYDQDTNLYTIDIDHSMFPINGNSVVSVNEGVDVVTRVCVDLSSTRHLWVDLENKHKMVALQSGTPLSFSIADVGRFVRMYWSKYDKHYYAIVSSFDPETAQHALLYEDGDIRRYDLRNRVDCEVLTLPSDLLETLSRLRLSADSNIEGSIKAVNVLAAKEVAKWHAMSLLPVEVPLTVAESNIPPSSSTDSSLLALPSKWLPISRPDARTVPVSFSECRVALINLFVNKGGFEIVFDLFRNKTVSPPVCRIIALYVELVYQLSRTWKGDELAFKVFRDSCWDAKETVPQALLRMGEAQIKDMQIAEFNEVCLCLRDIIQVSSASSASSQQRDEMHLNIEMMRMAMAAKLLGSGQLQKRYLGLSMIKDAIDSTYPKIAAFVLRRTQSLMGQKASAVAVVTNVPVKVHQSFQLQLGAFRSLISVESLDEWLTRNKVFDAVFGESLHQELAAKGELLLAYFAHRRLLTERHVEMLWLACARGAHEAVVRVMYHLIIFVVPVLQPFLRGYLFSLMASVPACDYTEQLLFLFQSFTVHALQASRDDRAKGVSESSQGNQSGGGTKDSGTKIDSNRASLPRKGHVVNAPQRQWLGFGVLWQFVQDPVLTKPLVGSEVGEVVTRVDEELVELAVRLLVELLEVEFIEEREEVMQRCLDNVHHGLSVAVSLQILRRVLALYPVSNKNWFSGIVGRPSQQAARGVSVSFQIERLIEQHNLLGVVFDDLNSYQNNFIEVAEESGLGALINQHESSAVAEKGVLTGRVGRMSHIRGVGERLDFLRFIVSHSNIRLGEVQTMILWRTFGEGALSGETLDRLCNWLDSLVMRDNRQLSILVRSLASESDLSQNNSQSKLTFLIDPRSAERGSFGAQFVSVFDEGVVVRLFDEGVLKWAFRRDKAAALSRPAVARLCMKLFLLTNISNRSLRVESADAPWSRTGHLHGLPLIWRMAVDATDENVSHAAISLLVELHHRTAPRLKAADSIRGSFFRQCFKQLYLAIQSLHGDDQTPSVSQYSEPMAVVSAGGVAGKAASQTKSLGDWFDDGCVSVTTTVISVRIARLISTVHLFVQRFYLSPSPLHSLRILAGRNESQVLTLVMRSSDTVGHLRAKVSKHFNETVADILLARVLAQSNSSSSTEGAATGAERLEKDELTLGQMRFSAAESIVVRRTDSAAPSPTTASADPSAIAPSVSSVALPDVLTVQDLRDEGLGEADPVGWLDMDRTYRLFHSAPFHLSSHTSRVALSEPSSGTKTYSSIEDSESEPLQTARGSDSLSALVRHHPLYVDQLLEMLDGYLSTEEREGGGDDHGTGFIADVAGGAQQLSAVVWDVLQLLPTQIALLEKVKDAIAEANSTDIALLLDASCSYRLLYTLQIIESMLNVVDDESTSKDCSPLLLSDGVQSVPSSGVQGSGATTRPSPSTFGSRATATEWAAKLFHMGGVDCIVTLIRSEIDKILSVGHKYNSSGRQRSESACYSTANPMLSKTEPHRTIQRDDKSVVLVALLSRILHRVLLLDGSYSGWQTEEPRVSGDRTVGSTLPAGVVESCVDTPQLARALLEVSTVISDLQSGGVISETAFRAFAEDGLRLLFGLLTSADDGLQLVQQHNISLSDWIAQMGVQNACRSSRGIVVWRIFEFCANISNRCADVGFTCENKSCRLNLLYFFVDSVKTCCVGDTVDAKSSLEQLYSLMAGLLWLSDSHHQAHVANVTDGVGDVSVIGSDENKILVNHFVSRFILHSSSETFHSTAPDGTLLGLLRVLLVLSSKGAQMCTEEPLTVDQDLVGHLYSRCLFPQQAKPTDAPSVEMLKALCQTADSRRLAMTLLLRLCDCDPRNLSRMLHVANRLDTDMASQQTSSFTRKCIQQWDYDPSQLAREAGAHVGLSNQGGTCYMNAFLQQLYHIPSFTDGLLAISSGSVNDSGENEAMLFQLQVMFGSMRLSQRRYFDTLPFCRSFIDYDGQPVNLGEQKDINEFAGMLFDKLEHNKACAALLADTLQGTLVWKTRSTESAYRSEREEPFYMITAEVKDKGSLEDSLELSVAEELFSGDNRIQDSEGRKVEALRRCAIRRLPSTLVVHLKRFEFDLETMQRKKVNDRISFPTCLDMFPYTEQGLAVKEAALSTGEFGPTVPHNLTDEFQYLLKGVVAHVGAIDRGHYYSFIRGNDSGVETEWREYNDRSVLPFSSESLERECFGGTDNLTGGAPAQPSRIKENSAYLLVYERVSKTISSERFEAVPSNGNGGDILSAPEPTVDSPVGERPVNAKRSRRNRPAAIAEGVEAAVWRANTQFQADRFLFDTANIQFILQLLRVGGGPPRQQLTDNSPSCNPLVTVNYMPLLVVTGLRLVMEVVVRARVLNCVHLFFSRLEEIILADSQSGKCAEAVLAELTRSDIDNSSWLGPNSSLTVSDESFPAQPTGGQSSKYQNDRDETERSCHPWLLEMFVYCPHGEAALSFSRLLVTCIKVLRPFQNTSFLVKDEGHHYVSSVSKLVSKLLVMLEKLLPDDAGHKDGYKLVASVLHQFAASGGEECHLLCSLGGIYRVVCSVLSVNPSANGVASGHLRDSVDLVVLLVKSCANVATPPLVVSDSNSSTPVSLAGPESLLQPEDVQAFLNRVFLEEAIQASSVQTSTALQHMCSLLGAKECLRVVEFLVEKVLEYTSAPGGTSLHYRPYFKVISDIVLNSTLVAGKDLSGPIGKLMNKPGGSDAELIYAVCKLCHRIATSSSAGHAAVLQMREFWRDIGLRVGNAKRLPVSVATSVPQTDVGHAR